MIPGKEILMFESLNKATVRTVKEGINTDDMDFVALYDKKRGLWPEAVGRELPVDGFFFTESKKYRKQVVVITLGYKVNLPKRYVETFEEIRDNKDMLEAVLAGKLKLTNIKEIDSANGKTAAFTLADA